MLISLRVNDVTYKPWSESYIEGSECVSVQG